MRGVRVAQVLPALVIGALAELSLGSGSGQGLSLGPKST